MDPRLTEWAAALGPSLAGRVRQGVHLAGFTSLGVGGPADLYLSVATDDELTEAVVAAHRLDASHLVLAGGSNLCVSDHGVRGVVIHNFAAGCVAGDEWVVSSGHALTALFLRAASAGRGGLEFAVGIPGSVGGALVSNAGAYRRSIGELITGLSVIEDGALRRVGAEWMEFAYRDSRLRRPGARPACVVSARLGLATRPRPDVMAEARAYQANRILRQPWARSAGSFFKNVNDRALADRVPGLPEPLRRNGVVPAGYLSEAAGCRGLRMGGAQVSPRHGNFIVNAGGATAADVRALADEVRRRVACAFGVELREEIIYVGEWPGRYEDA